MTTEPNNSAEKEPTVRMSTFTSAVNKLSARLAEVERERDDYHRKACEIADQRDRAEEQLTRLKAELERANGLLARVPLDALKHVNCTVTASDISAHLNPKKTP